MSQNSKFRGMFCPIKTPYKTNYEIDYEDLRNEVEFCVHSGMQGIVTTVNGGEFHTLSDEEHREVNRVTAAQAKGRISIVAGINGWSTKHCVERAKYAEDFGYDAIMSMPPVVAKPATFDSIRRFFAALDKAVSIPIFIQNAPPMGQALTPDEMLLIMRECENVTYVKEETEFTMEYVSELATRGALERPGVFEGVMSGLSGLTFIDAYLRGACGCMPTCHFGDVFATVWECQRRFDFARKRQLNFAGFQRRRDVRN